MKKNRVIAIICSAVLCGSLLTGCGFHYNNTSSKTETHTYTDADGNEITETTTTIKENGKTTTTVEKTINGKPVDDSNVNWNSDEKTVERDDRPNSSEEKREGGINFDTSIIDETIGDLFRKNGEASFDIGFMNLTDEDIDSIIVTRAGEDSGFELLTVNCIPLCSGGIYCNNITIGDGWRHMDIQVSDTDGGVIVFDDYDISDISSSGILFVYEVGSTPDSRRLKIESYSEKNLENYGYHINKNSKNGGILKSVDKSSGIIVEDKPSLEGSGMIKRIR